jgi:hypothetical protein
LAAGCVFQLMKLHNWISPGHCHLLSQSQAMLYGRCLPQTKKIYKKKKRTKIINMSAVC